MRVKLPALRRCRTATSATAIFFALGLCATALTVAGLRTGRRAPSAGAAPVSQQPPASARSHRNLSLSPAAHAMSRRLGRRFREEGREVTVFACTLNVGGEARRARVRREQTGDSEVVEVTFANRDTLVWDAERGATSPGHEITDEERAVVERIALDSPDRFVLAQLRGASYYVVARGVRLSGDGGGDGYAGPLYDVVRVAGQEPDGGWRLYYIDSSTGLLGRVVSEWRGGQLVAELTGWGDHGGELWPSRTVWSLEGQVVMELTLTNVTNGPAQ